MDLHLTVNQEHALSQWNEGKLGPTWLSCPAWLLAICPFYCAGKEGSCAGHYSEPPEAR